MIRLEGLADKLGEHDCRVTADKMMLLPNGHGRGMAPPLQNAALPAALVRMQPL